MLTQRIIGALTFNKAVYKEVEHDTSFTSTAWIIVAVSAFLNQLGANSHFGLSEIGSWVLATGFFTVTSILGFALAALVMSWLAKAIFNADVTFSEMVRTIGLASIWNAFGVISLVGGIVPALGCLLAPVGILAALLGLAAWFIALQEAVDLDLGQTILLVIVGFIVNMIIGAVAGVIIGIFGISAGLLAGMFS